MLMSLPLTDANSTDVADIVLPPHPDGGAWPYAVIMASGEVLVADSVTELVAAGLPGYGDLPDDEEGFDEGLVARYEDLVGHAAAFQRQLMSIAHAFGTVDIPSLDDDTVTALMSERSVPVEDIPEWTCPVPLVLISTDYIPYTDRPAPEGNVVMLDPVTEVTYLQSLTKIGALRFLVGNGVRNIGGGSDA
jgi:hypothetical protein